MVVNRIQANVLTQRTKQQVLRLQEGQVVEGKITKLYGNQRAEIKIGSTTLIAQIEASLSVGKSYYFQVQDMGGDIYLKVLHELKGQAATFNVHELMDQLQVRITNQTLPFVETLIRNGIPFNRQQLHDAIQLLHSSSVNQETAITVIQSMLQQKLPITPSVFQALIAYHTEDFSSLLQHVHQQLQSSVIPSTEDGANVIKQLETLLQKPIGLEVAVSQLIHRGIKDNHANFVLFQLLDMISPSLNRMDATKQMERFIQSQSTEQYPLLSMDSNEELRQVMKDAQQSISLISTNEEALQKVAMKLMGVFHPLKSGTLVQDNFSALEKMIKTELTPLLPKNVNSKVIALLANLANKTNQTTLYQYLQAFIEETGYDLLEQVRSTMYRTSNYDIAQLPLQQQFLNHVENVVQSLGLNAEHELVRALQVEPSQIIEQTQTIKSLLLHMVQQTGATNESVQQLLHFINGLQLQSLTESNQLLQAQFLLPGNKLGLNQDMFIQFESNKSNNDTIDTDYCRIFFMLDLRSIQETMIDMHVQKRIVSISIYNDYLSVKNRTEQLQHVLKENLTNLDYKLSAIQWKPLYNNKVSFTDMDKPKQQREARGFDFRI